MAECVTTIEEGETIDETRFAEKQFSGEDSGSIG